MNKSLDFFCKCSGVFWVDRNWEELAEEGERVVACSVNRCRSVKPIKSEWQQPICFLSLLIFKETISKVISKGFLGLNCSGSSSARFVTSCLFMFRESIDYFKKFPLKRLADCFEILPKYRKYLKQLTIVFFRGNVVGIHSCDPGLDLNIHLTIFIY